MCFFLFFFKEFDLHINIVIKNNFKSFVVINKKKNSCSHFNIRLNFKSELIFGFQALKKIKFSSTIKVKSFGVPCKFSISTNFI